MCSPVPVALFTSAEKTQRKSISRRFAMVLLAFFSQQIDPGISLRAAFYLFAVAQVGAVFPQVCEGCNSFACVDKLQSEQIFPFIHVCEVISALFILKTMFWAFSLLHFFFFTKVDVFSKVRGTSTGFPKRGDRILIIEKDAFNTRLK